MRSKPRGAVDERWFVGDAWARLGSDAPRHENNNNTDNHHTGIPRDPGLFFLHRSTVFEVGHVGEAGFEEGSRTPDRRVEVESGGSDCDVPSEVVDAATGVACRVGRGWRLD